MKTVLPLGGVKAVLTRAGAKTALPVVAVAAALAVYPVLGIGTEYHLTVAVLCLLLAVQAVSWNILSGYAGYISLGHSAFLGTGAYMGGIAAERLGINPLLSAPLGGVLAAGVAVALGAVVLRSRGAAFVIVTIALLLTLQVLATNLTRLTHGNQGLAMPLPPWSRETGNLPFYYLFLGLLILTLAFSAWVRTRKLGAGLLAIREDEGKAAAIGIPTTRYKVTAFASGAFFTGVAGGIYGYFLSYISPTTMFAVLASVMVVLAALLGGRGSLYGPVVGAFVVAIGSEAATVYGGGSSSRLLLFGGCSRVWCCSCRRGCCRGRPPGGGHGIRERWSTPTRKARWGGCRPWWPRVWSGRRPVNSCGSAGCRRTSGDWSRWTAPISSCGAAPSPV